MSTHQQAQVIAIVQRVLTVLPHGVKGKKYLPVQLNGQPMELRIFKESDHGVVLGGFAFAFYWADKRYARITLNLYDTGQLEYDDRGTMPTFDEDVRDERIRNLATAQLLQVITEAVDRPPPR